MNKRTFVLVHAEARARAAQFIAQEAPQGYCVTISEPTRTLTQNAALWARLGDIAKQVVWHGRRLDTASWKMIFTAALKKQDVVPGIDGGFVVMGSSTSKMTKSEMAELLELIAAFGAERNVRFGGDDAYQ